MNLLYHMLIKILDDFLMMEPMSLENPYNRAVLVFQALGIPTAPGKTFGPSQILEFLGIELDSSLMEARLPYLRTRLRKSDKS